MNPERKQEFDKLIGDLQTPEELLPRPEPSQAPEPAEVDIPLMDLPDDGPENGPIADIQEAFDDGARQTVQPRQPNHWRAQRKANEQNEEIKPLDPKPLPRQELPGGIQFIQVDPPKFDLPEDNQPPKQPLAEFMADMAAQGKLDANGQLRPDEIPVAVRDNDLEEVREDAKANAAGPAYAEIMKALATDRASLRDFAKAVSLVLNDHAKQIRDITDAILRRHG